MGDRFNNYKAQLEKERTNDKRASAEADDQFNDLRDALSRFNRSTVLDFCFAWDADEGRLTLGDQCLGLTPARKGEPRKVWFGQVPPPDGPKSQAAPRTLKTWSVQPAIDMFDEFNWRVSDLDNSVTTEELADEAAIELTNMAIGRSGQR